MPIFLDQFINIKPAKEFHVCEVISADFLHDMNEKLHIIIQVFIYQINCTPAYIYRNLYHSEGMDLQLNIIYSYQHSHGVVLN
jgi:hypothetical protein